MDRRSPNQQLWDELEHSRQATSSHQTLVPNLINALAAEREQIPAARLQSLKASRRVAAVTGY